MNIALLTNIPLPISFQTPAGTEVFTAYLLQGLKKNGHSVTIYGTKNNDTNTVGFFTPEEFIQKTKNLSPLKYQNLIFCFQNLLIKKLIDDSNKYDIIHNNMYLSPIIFPFLNTIRTPIIHTVHHDLFQNESFADFVNQTLRDTDTLVYVSSYAKQISKVTRGLSETIYNSIDTKLFLFNQTGGEKMLWFGRMSPTKGLRESLEIQESVKRPLQISVFTNEKMYKEYFQKEIVPRIKDNLQINIIENIQFKDKILLLGNSKLFLFPLQWEEPFGLVLLESMATGTPVVTFARGATSEIVKDGETGYLVNPSDRDVRGNWITEKTGLEGIIDAVNRIYSMSPKEYKSMRLACKKHVEMNFSLAKMSQNYENLYRKILNKHA